MARFFITDFSLVLTIFFAYNPINGTGNLYMRIIATVAFTMFTAFFISSNAMAVTVTNTDKCIVAPCVGTDCQNHSVNSVSSQCTSKKYDTVKRKSDNPLDEGESYGIYQECTACPSGYYVSDTKTSIPHTVCGAIEYYKTCAQASTCRGTPPTPAAASTVSNCSSASKATFGKTTYYTCNTCNSGYTRTAVTISDERCTNTTTKYTCVADEPDCDETTCVSNPSGVGMWRAIGRWRLRTNIPFMCQ